MLRLLLRAAAVLGLDVQCPVCRFHYDPKYGHSCVPC